MSARGTCLHTIPDSHGYAYMSYFSIRSGSIVATETRSRAGTIVSPMLPEPVPETPTSQKKKEKESRVRFVEQKKLYIYNETTPPTETLQIQKGFVTALGLSEDEV